MGKPPSKLTVTYGKNGRGNLNQLLNRAIRAELAGGTEAIEALTRAKNAADLRGWRTREGDDTKEADLYYSVLDIIDAMEDEIRKRYGLGERPEQEGGHRRGRSVKSGS